MNPRFTDSSNPPGFPELLDEPDDEAPTNPRVPALAALSPRASFGAIDMDAPSKTTLVPPPLAAFEVRGDDMSRTSAESTSLSPIAVAPRSGTRYVLASPRTPSMRSLVEAPPSNGARNWIAASVALLAVAMVLTSGKAGRRAASAEAKAASAPPIEAPSPETVPAHDLDAKRIVTGLANVTLPTVELESHEDAKRPMKASAAPRSQGSDAARNLLEAEGRRRAGDRKGSLALYEKVLRRDPNNSEALTGVGEIALAEYDVPKAIAMFRSTISSNASYLPALIDLSDALALSGHPSSARDVCRDVVARFPEDVVPARTKNCAETAP